MTIDIVILKAVVIELVIAILALTALALMPEPRKKRGPWDRK